jgi:hypothetical protein
MIKNIMNTIPIITVPTAISFVTCGGVDVDVGDGVGEGDVEPGVGGSLTTGISVTISLLTPI